MMKKPFALAAAMAVSVGSFAFAQQDRTQSGSQNQNQTGAISQGATARERTQGSQGAQQHDEKKFVEHAASGNQFEIQLSQFVQQQAQDPQVKQLAQKLAQDHQQAQQQLKQAAQAMGVTVQDQLMPAHQAKLHEMQKKQGAELERAYLFCNVGDHHKDIMVYSWEAKNAQNPQLKQYCEQTLQHLRQHMQQVDQVAAAVTGINEAQTASERIPADATHSGSDHSTGHTGAGSSGAGSSSSGGGTSGSSNSNSGSNGVSR